MKPNLKYEDVKAYLCALSTNEPPYDFNGVLQLVLAGVENLRTNAVDQDFVDYAWTISEEQAALLQRLIDSRSKSTAHSEKER